MELRHVVKIKIHRGQITNNIVLTYSTPARYSIAHFKKYCKKLFQTALFAIYLGHNVKVMILYMQTKYIYLAKNIMLQAILVFFMVPISNYVKAQTFTKSQTGYELNLELTRHSTDRVIPTMYIVHLKVHHLKQNTPKYKCNTIKLEPLNVAILLSRQWEANKNSTPQITCEDYSTATTRLQLQFSKLHGAPGPFTPRNPASIYKYNQLQCLHFKNKKWFIVVISQKKHNLVNSRLSTMDPLPGFKVSINSGVLHTSSYFNILAIFLANVLQLEGPAACSMSTSRSGSPFSIIQFSDNPNA